jgi:hypothetical protein
MAVSFLPPKMFNFVQFCSGMFNFESALIVVEIYLHTFVMNK